MNIALSTLIILVILLPGLTFRRFYFTEEFSKQYFKSSFFDIIFSSLFPAFLFHSIWFFLVKLFGIEVNLEIIGELLSAKDFPREAFKNIQNNFFNIGMYHLTIISVAGFLGFVTKYTVRKKELDRKYKIFRFKNYWHYILKGEFFDFPRASFDLENDEVNDIELIYIDALVDTKEGTILYEGILVDYELSSNGSLEQIHIKEAYRKFLVNTKTESNIDDNQFYSELFPMCKLSSEKSISYQIPGHIVVLPYKTILNLNFSYYKLVEISNDEYDVQLVN